MFSISVYEYVEPPKMEKIQLSAFNWITSDKYYFTMTAEQAR